MIFEQSVHLMLFIYIKSSAKRQNMYYKITYMKVPKKAGLSRVQSLSRVCLTLYMPCGNSAL